MNLQSKAQDFVKEDYSRYEKIDAFILGLLFIQFRKVMN